MQKIISVTHVFVLLSVGLYAWAPQAFRDSQTQMIENAPGESLNQPLTSDQDPILYASDTTSSQPSAILFVENVGQFDPEVRFQAKTDLGTAFLADNEIWFTLLEETNFAAYEEGTTAVVPLAQNGQLAFATPTPPEENPVTGVHLRLSFVDSNSNARVEGFNPLDARVSFMTGNDAEEWHTDVPVWGGVRYVDFYPGYDLEITSESNQWVWQLVQKKTVSSGIEALVQNVAYVNQGSESVQEIRIKVDGADSLALNEGELIISTAVQDIKVPVPGQTSEPSALNSQPGETDIEPELEANELILPLDVPTESQPTSLRLPARSEHMSSDRTNASGGKNAKLIIDRFNSSLTSLNLQSVNGIEYSTYFGGSNGDTIYDVALDASGATYVVGDTISLDFPTTPGAFNMPSQNSDVFVSKLSPDGKTLEFSARIGGSSIDVGLGIAVNETKGVFVTGRTLSADLPTTSGAFDRVNSGSEAFVMRLNSSGTQLIYSSYLGAGATQGYDIAVNQVGQAYVVGETLSADFPTTEGVLSPTINGDWDGFVSRFNEDGSGLIFSTFLGGSGSDCEISGDRQECSIALGKNGEVFIAGQTFSSNFPTTPGAYDETYNGSYDLFVSKLAPDGSALTYSTFIGGVNDDGCGSECSLAVDQNGSVYVAGSTLSTDFPTTVSAYDRSHNGNWDVFITKLSPDGSDLIYSTYLGTAQEEIGRGIGITNDGSVVITGETFAGNFPVSDDAYQATFGGLRDAFVTVLNPGGSDILYSTYLGGNGDELGFGITARDQVVVAAGWTASTGFPTTGGAYRENSNGGTDGYITKFILSSPSADGPVIEDQSVVSSGSAGDECNDCIGCSVNNTQGGAGGPINTRTGGYDYTVTDLSFVTTAGELSFVHTYSSLALDLSTTLSPGWTHNQDMRLIFPDDPGGRDGVVLLKSRSANRYSFLINTDGTYTASPGIHASLIHSSTQYVVKDSSQNEYIFNEDGQLISFVNPQGHVWDYSYNGDGSLKSISANEGDSYLTFTYNAQGRLVSLKDHSERTVSFTYDTAGDLVTVTDVLGQDWTYTYDSAHRLTTVIDPLGQTVERTEYDARGRAVRQYDGEDNLVVELTYNLDGTTTVTDALGNDQTHTYDSRGTLVSETNALNAEMGTVYGDNFEPTQVTNAAGHTLSMTWSADGLNLLNKTDPTGNTIQNTYDGLNNVTSTTDPQGNTTTYTYSGKLLLTQTDALDGRTTYTYTPEGYLASVMDSAGRTTSYTYNVNGQRDSMTDSGGNTWTYTYDTLGRLTDTTDSRHRVSHTEYNAAGQIVRSVQNYSPSHAQNDQNVYNIVTEYEYDARGKQVAVIDTFGRTTQYIYDNAGRLTQTIDALGNTTTSIYNAAGQLTATQDALGNKTTYIYDETDRLLNTINALGISSGTTTFNIPTNTSTVTNSIGATTTFYYDELGRVVRTVDALGNSTLTSYDENGNVESQTDQLGRVTHYEYDELNRLIRTIDPNGGVTESIYDDEGQRIASIDALGKQTTFMYDAFGRLTTTTDPLRRVTRTEYDVYGQRVASIDAAEHRTEYTYDLLDRVIAVEDALGNVISTSYDALGNVLARTDANGHVTAYTYDSLNRILTVTDPNGNTTTNTYDAAGNLIASSNALGETTTYSYDALNRRTAITDPLGNTTRTYFNSLGQVSDVADANGAITHFEYDVLGRQIAVVLSYQPTVQPDADTNVRTEYTYNAVGNRESVRDPNGNVTHYTYDVLNRVIGKSDPLGNTWSYTYDAAGNQITMTDAKSQVTRFTYDDARQLTKIDYPDSDVTFTYTVTGQRDSMQDALGTTAWTYDDLNRMVSVADPSNQTVGYGYDAVGNRTRLIYPDGHAVNYAFDPANRLTTVNDPEIGVTYAYDNANRLSEVSRTNDVDTSYTYDAAGRVTNLTHSDSQDLLASYEYTYDAAGNLTQAIENVSRPAPTGPTPTATPLPIGSDIYLHGTGSNANPETLFLNTTAPSGSTAKYKDSPNIKFNNGNPWKEVGTWTSTSADIHGQLTSLSDLHVWLGLQDNGNQKKHFDLRAEVYKNGELITDGESLCITDITGRAENAKEATLAFDAFDPITLDGETNSLSIKILARAGTDGAGHHCGGSNTAVGLRLYFDSTTRPAKFGASTPPASTLAIDYTYDALRRLKSANYSDGRSFSYKYDPNGNTLEANSDLGAGVITTAYTYDIANQLMTAQADSTIWHYVYDANGSLTEVLPDGDEASGAKRYIYNTAGYLTQIESHSGSDWISQAEMTYTGLGTRMTSSALGITTQYVSDGQMPVAITSNGNTTTVLYGLGPVAEKTDVWNYVLNDGRNIPRQLTDMDGEITLSARYNPWGKPIETSGTGNFDASFIGTVIDATTGLIYIGNGQYYDPETGRFLTRRVNPNSSNPYVPWNLNTLLLGPLGLVSLCCSQKKVSRKGRNRAILIAIIVLAMANLACCEVDSTPEPTQEPDTTETTEATPGPTTEPGTQTPTPPSAPTEPPVDSACPCGPETREDVITGVTRVLYKEAASSFVEFDRSLRVFERLAWATRSIKIHPETNSDKDYETLVQSGRYSAAGEYKTPFGNEEPYRNITRRILSEENASQVPGEIRDQFIQWMSPQLFPRRAGGLIQKFVDPEVPGCGWSDPQVCELPDLRYVNNFRSSDIGTLTEERFIELGELDPYDTHTYPQNDSPTDPHDGPNDGKVLFAQDVYFTNECYWIGIYFMHKSEHTALTALSNDVAKNYAYPTASDAINLSCSTYLPEIINP